jgi:hypothetical protein
MRKTSAAALCVRRLHVHGREGRSHANILQLTFVTFEALYLRAFPQCYKIAVGKALSNLLPPRSVQAQFRHRALTSSRADKASDGQSARLATDGRRHANWRTPYFSGFDSIVIGDSHQTQSSVGRTTANPNLQGTECEFDLTFVERDNAGHLRLSRSFEQLPKATTLRDLLLPNCLPTAASPE